MRFIVVEDGLVISVRTGTSPVGEEFESELGEVGQIMHEDGTFTTPDPEEDVGFNEETDTKKIERKLDELKNKIDEDNIAQFEVLATIYEELIMKGLEEV